MVVALIGDIALSGAELAAALAPVPWLKPAVGLVKDIVELVENVPKNRKAAEQLAGCCNNLYNGVKASCTEKHPDAVKKMAEELTTFLEKVKKKMEAWNEKPPWKRFLMQEQIADDIKESLQDVHNISDKMGLVAQLEQFTMMTDFEENRKADKNELMKFLHDKENEDELRWVAQKAREDKQTEMLEVLLRLMKELSTTFHHKDERNISICKNMFAIQHESKVLLPDVALPSNLVRKTTDEVAGGSVFSIYEGLYCEKQKCAIKAVRPLSNADPKTRERLDREAEIWRMICESDEHKEYILPLLGVCYDAKPWPWLVSPWMQKGDAAHYVKSHDGVNHRRLIHRIAIGISILHAHDPPIVHGHLKGSHILIDERGDPLLTDFGLSKVLVDLKGVPVSEIRGISASWRWFAPETMVGPGLLTEKSDVYSYAMTVLELMTHKEPYAHVSLTSQAIRLISEGTKPSKPTDPEIEKRGLNDKLWDLLCHCWSSEPDDRPTIQEVLVELPNCGHF